MAEIQEGHGIGLQRVLAGGLTFQGKPLNFEQVDKENNVYQARAELTQEEIDAGNRVEQLFTVQFPTGEGIINRTGALPKLLEKKNKDFEGKTDAEKHTIINSLSYAHTGQVKLPEENNSLIDGARATPTGQKAQDQAKKTEESKSSTETKKDVEDSKKLGDITAGSSSNSKVSSSTDFKK
ncbi:MAG: hypothetical protein ACTHME_03365 [Candidatus Nitrosocosmicus sp.]